MFFHLNSNLVFIFQIQFEKWGKVVSSISIFPWIKFVCQAIPFETDDNAEDNDGDNNYGNDGGADNYEDSCGDDDTILQNYLIVTEEDG